MSHFELFLDDIVIFDPLKPQYVKTLDLIKVVPHLRPLRNAACVTNYLLNESCDSCRTGFFMYKLCFTQYLGCRLCVNRH